MENVIEKDGDLIGFADDLKRYFETLIQQVVENSDYENADDLLEMLKELRGFENETAILVASENNGMGFSVRKYSAE